MKAILMLAAAALPFTAVAEMYRCTEDGRTVFQERPCPGKGKAVDIRPQAGDAPRAARSDQPAGNASSDRAAVLADLQNARLQRELKYDISRSESEIRELEKRMEAELAALRNRKRFANNNLAGATWEQSISGEMQAVTEKYRSQISTAQAKLDRQHKELDDLKRAAQR